MKAEEILKESIGEIRYSLNGTVTNSQLIYAMEEYAKQQMKEFAEWIDENNCVFDDNRNLWIDKAGKIFTTDQLIEEFLNK